MSHFILPGESEEYRKLREELLTAEIALKDQIGVITFFRTIFPAKTSQG